MAIVMGVLIVSFAVWGIADIFKGFGQSSLAKIGSTEISTEQFRQIYTDKLQQLGRSFGRPLTPEQARAFGLDRQVLQQTIAEAALDEEARRMGLAQSQEETMRLIYSDPNFKGLGGGFDPARFQATIRQFGYTEQRYLAEQRRVGLRRQIVGTVSAGVEPSKVLLDALIRYQNEQRSIEFIKLDAAQAGTIDPPSPEALAAFFEDHKTQFRAPEYRKIAFVAITPEEIGKWTEVTDEDARKIFEQNRDRLGTPEKREVSQIVFPNEGEAQAARGRITSGTSFDDIAKERNLNLSDVDLGLIAKSAIIDPAIADAAFSLPSGEVSQPVQGRFGVALVKIGKIEPGVTPTFESVAAQVKKEIATERARAKVTEMQNKMEDERSGGANVVEAAQKLGLTAVTIEAVDRSGRLPDGQPLANIPRGLDVVSQAFNSDVGVDNDPISVRRRLCLVRRARHHALARTHARRSPQPGRSEMARGPDLEPAAGKGHRDGAETRARRHACRRCRCGWREGRDGGRLPPRCLAARRAFRRRDGCLPDRQGRRRSNRPAPAAANGSCTASLT